MKIFHLFFVFFFSFVFLSAKISFVDFKETIHEKYLDSEYDADEDFWVTLEDYYYTPIVLKEITRKEINYFFWLSEKEKEEILKNKNKIEKLIDLKTQNLLSDDSFSLMAPFVVVSQEKSDWKINTTIAQSWSKVKSLDANNYSLRGKLNVSVKDILNIFYLVDQDEYESFAKLKKWSVAFNYAGEHNDNDYDYSLYAGSLKTHLGYGLLFSTKFSPFFNAENPLFLKGGGSYLKQDSGGSENFITGVGGQINVFNYSSFLTLGWVDYAANVVTNDFFYSDLEYVNSFKEESVYQTNENIATLKKYLFVSHHELSFGLKNTVAVDLLYSFFNVPVLSDFEKEEFYGSQYAGLSFNGDFYWRQMNFWTEGAFYFSQKPQDIYDPSSSSLLFSFAHVLGVKYLLNYLGNKYLVSYWRYIPKDYTPTHNRSFTIASSKKDELGLATFLVYPINSKLKLITGIDYGQGIEARFYEYNFEQAFHWKWTKKNQLKLNYRFREQLSEKKEHQIKVRNFFRKKTFQWNVGVSLKNGSPKEESTELLIDALLQNHLTWSIAKSFKFSLKNYFVVSRENTFYTSFYHNQVYRDYLILSQSTQAHFVNFRWQGSSLGMWSFSGGIIQKSEDLTALLEEAFNLREHEFSLSFYWSSR